MQTSCNYSYSRCGAGCPMRPYYVSSMLGFRWARNIPLFPPLLHLMGEVELKKRSRTLRNLDCATIMLKREYSFRVQQKRTNPCNHRPEMRPKKETIMAGCTREREFVRGRTLQKVNSRVITDIFCDIQSILWCERISLVTSNSNCSRCPGMTMYVR